MSLIYSISLENVFQIVSVFRLTRDSPSFKDELDIMKFICKDFWTKVFRRQVDNLRTNHQVEKQDSRGTCCWTNRTTDVSSDPLPSQGTYVLQDNKFCLLTQLSSGKQYLDQAPKVHFEFLLHTAITRVQLNTMSRSQCAIKYNSSVFSPSVPCFFVRRGERSSV